jgi:uncharacterized membrane protein YcfT
VVFAMRLSTSRSLALVVALISGAALACPVCGTPSEQGQGAYLFMTPIMSLLPLALVGGLVFWLVRRVRRAERDEAHPSTPGAAPEQR